MYWRLEKVVTIQNRRYSHPTAPLERLVFRRRPHDTVERVHLPFVGHGLDVWVCACEGFVGLFVAVAVSKNLGLI